MEEETTTGHRMYVTATVEIEALQVKWLCSIERTETELKTPHCNKLCTALVKLTLFSHKILHWTLPTLKTEQYSGNCVLPVIYAAASSLSIVRSQAPRCP